MHQPFYKDLVTGEYVLPWVRLHAIKDYYDMVAILDNFPNIKQTFNLVPSLIEQMQEYVEGTAVDKHLALTIKEARDLTNDDKDFILQNFFMSNWDTMVNPYKRYHELLLKRGRFVTSDEIKAVAKRFTDQEMLDLQVWFNLSWFGHIYKSTDETIKGLIKKGRDFSKEDKEALLNKQKELIAKVMPKYKELFEKGQIGISVTPYYHPILPLLIDTNSAKEAIPNIKLPQHRFRHPEDALYQIDSAVKFAKNIFGTAPCGMWPSEGSVSPDIIPLVADSGIKWIATDEEILASSLGRRVGGAREISSVELFRPYKVEKDGRSVSIIFRDHNLSDLVGFVYSKWNPADAARDFVKHLNNIKDSLPDDGNEYLVSIILDGENAWEYYQNNGWDFLSELYSKISNDQGLRAVRVCDHLEKNPPKDTLNHLFSGSWINHNFRIWIGHDEDNTAWDHLAKARLALEGSGNKNELAWKELYIAEGSDWCWWYGDDHSSGNDNVFDALFRKHLKNIYQLIGKSYPQYLDVPIKFSGAIEPSREPSDIVSPIIDGEMTNYYEWLAAGYFDISRLKGAMHQAETLITGIYWGFDINNFQLRLDVNMDFSINESKNITFSIVTMRPKERKITAMYDQTSGKYVIKLYKPKDDSWEEYKTLDSVGIKTIVEMSVPFADIDVSANDQVSFIATVSRDNMELERWPRGGTINFQAPATDYVERQWSV
jgi:alpha-amylase/alpha-mannosidase (GH57 family)